MEQMTTSELPIYPNADYYYNHFNTRLIERYGISITVDEYVELCKIRITPLYVLSPNKRFGIIQIKGRDVYVIRCNASKLLNTCYPQYSPFPVPLRYKRDGVSIEQFNTDLNNAIKNIGELSDLLIELNDKRKFFIEKPGNYPDWMYGAAYQKVKLGYNYSITRTVYNLYKTERI